MALVWKIDSFGDIAVWSFLSQFFMLAVAMLLGNTLRRKIPVIRKSLVPTALLGGALILILKAIPAFESFINYAAMETVTYHCLAIGFIAVALKRVQSKQKGTIKTLLETGVVQGATYALQASLGLAVTIALALTLPNGFFPGGGVLLALGFGQGTGQALNYGKLYETSYGFEGGATFGLTIATVGFFVASIVGVIYMNILRKKGKLRLMRSEDEKVSEKLEDYVTDNEIPSTESVDRLTLNIALVLSVYAVTYVVMRLVNINLVWGFNFLLGSLLALLCKVCMKQFKKFGWMHREIVNDHLMDRISGFAFDFMIIAGCAAINLNKVYDLLWPLIIVCAVGTTATFAYLRWVTYHLYPGYEHEAFLSLFGMLTGTASNGMILLREVDPTYETPAATNMVLSGVPAIAFGGGLLVVLGYCPKGLTPAIVTLAILSAAAVIFTLVLFRQKIFRKKDK